MVKLVTLAMLLLAVTPARAEPPDPDTAQRLSIAGSVAPIAMLGIGTFVAATGNNSAIRDFGAATALTGALLGVISPSLGHFYSHEYLDPALALRAGGLIVEVVGLVKATNSEIGDCTSHDPSCHLQTSTYVTIGVGIAMYLGGMALDIAWKPDTEIRIVPIAFRLASSTVPGVAATFRF